MAFGTLIKDFAGTPLSQEYVPGVGFKALKGSTNVNTDGSSNDSAAAAVALEQSLSLSATLQSAQSGNVNGTVLSLLGMSAILFTVNMAAYTGTVNFECTEDGTNYVPFAISQIDTVTPTVALTLTGSTTTSIHLYEASCANLQSIRARTSGASAGSVTVTAHAIPQSLAPRIMNVGVVSAGTLALESGGNLAMIATRTPALGQATSANSRPVVIASDQGVVPIYYLNGDITILASAARTTTQTSADQTNNIGRGLRVVVDVTSAGTGSITCTINRKDTASGKYILLLAGAAITTNSTNSYLIYPGMTAVANSVANDVLPRTFQVVITANNANSVTFSVGASILL